jgi:hypothetical protein
MSRHHTEHSFGWEIFRCYEMGTVRYPSLKRSQRCVFIVFLRLFLRSGCHKVYRYTFCCVSLLGSCNNGISRVIRCILLHRESPQKPPCFLTHEGQISEKRLLALVNYTVRVIICGVLRGGKYSMY